MYAGEIVHVWWRGVCTAAMIVVPDLSDQQSPDLLRFERGGMTQHVRSSHGKHGEDLHFHYLSECPDITGQVVDNAMTPLAVEPEEESPEGDEPLTDEEADDEDEENDVGVNQQVQVSRRARTRGV